MKTFFIFALFSLPAIAEDPLFTTVSYYDGLGKKFRVETVSNWPKCKEVKRAQKIFLDETNELREVAWWNEKGEMFGAGKSNNPEAHKKVNAIFAQSRTSGNPCKVPPPAPETKSSDAFEQIELGGPEPEVTDPTLH